MCDYFNKVIIKIIFWERKFGFIVFKLFIFFESFRWINSTCLGFYWWIMVFFLIKFEGSFEYRVGSFVLGFESKVGYVCY